MSPDALDQWRDVLTLDLADDDPDYPGPVGHYLATERLRAVEAELARRNRLARLSTGAARRGDQRYQQWRELARCVRERVSMIDVLEHAGWTVVPAGRDRRRGFIEYHGACPACGGTDRFIVWTARAWCRQCALSWDVIAATESLIPGCQGFRDALTWLATLAGTGTVPR